MGEKLGPFLRPLCPAITPLLGGSRVEEDWEADPKGWGTPPPVYDPQVPTPRGRTSHGSSQGAVGDPGHEALDDVPPPHVPPARVADQALGWSRESVVSPACPHPCVPACHLGSKPHEHATHDKPRRLSSVCRTHRWPLPCALVPLGPHRALVWGVRTPIPPASHCHPFRMGGNEEHRSPSSHPRARISSRNCHEHSPPPLYRNSH